MTTHTGRQPSASDPWGARVARAGRPDRRPPAGPRPVPLHRDARLVDGKLRHVHRPAAAPDRAVDPAVGARPPRSRLDARPRGHRPGALADRNGPGGRRRGLRPGGGGSDRPLPRHARRLLRGPRRPARGAADGHLAHPDHRPSSPACRATRGPCSPGCAPTAPRGAPPRSPSPGPSGALRSGLVPADLRAALYAALAALPAVTRRRARDGLRGQRRASRSCTTTGPPARS